MAQAIVEYYHCTAKNGDLWLEIAVNGHRGQMIGPFDTATERQRVHDDMLEMMRSVGAKDMPLKVQ